MSPFASGFFRAAGTVVLLIVGPIALFEGLETLKARSTGNGWRGRDEIRGRAAIWIGTAWVVLGVLCLVLVGYVLLRAL